MQTRLEILKDLRRYGCRIETTHLSYGRTEDKIFFPYPKLNPVHVSKYNRFDPNPILYTYKANDQEQKSLKCVITGSSWNASNSEAFVRYYAHQMKMCISDPLVIKDLHYKNRNSLRDLDLFCFRKGFFCISVNKDKSIVRVIHHDPVRLDYYKWKNFSFDCRTDGH
jgi:hypothetical protein